MNEENYQPETLAVRAARGRSFIADMLENWAGFIHHLRLNFECLTFSK